MNVKIETIFSRSVTDFELFAAETKPVNNVFSSILRKNHSTAYKSSKSN